MAMPEAEQDTGAGGFRPTRWSVVLAAASLDSDAAAGRALEELCRTYWFPLYAYVRRKGYAAADAEDLVQAFFARLLEKRSVAAADPARGRFRAFLLGSLKNFLFNEWDRHSAAKRGGGTPVIELDALAAEERCRLEPACNEAPERIFDREWALAVLDASLRRLRAEHEAGGRGLLFERLKGAIAAAPETAPYAEIAAELKISEDLVKVAVHRLRKRYREILREEVAQTVDSAGDLDGELRHLLDCLRTEPG